MAVELSQTAVFQCAARIFSVCFPFATYSIKETSIQGLRFNRMRNFPHSVENVLRWNWQNWQLTPTPRWCTVKYDYKTVWRHCPDWCWDTGRFSHHCFHSIIANVNTIKKTNNVLVLLWPFGLPETASGTRSEWTCRGKWRSLLPYSSLFL